MMKSLMKSILIAVVCGLGSHVLGAENALDPVAVKSLMKKVADWQIEHLNDDIGRIHQNDNRLDAWTYGALYVGMVKWAGVADDDSYYEFLKGIGDGLNWNLRAKYHADGMIIGQLYAEMFRRYQEPKMLKSLQKKLEWIQAHPSQQPINLDHYKNTERWTWCDALFMAPPVWARLSEITGDSSYNEFMFAEYKATYDHLYDPDTHLFFRDEHFIQKRDEGRKVFWARGNGWVFGSLALIIPELPEGAMKEWFVALYKEMAPAVAKLQTPEGFWAMSLLCADKYPTPETSGSSFFTYGLAWGINNGILDRKTYEPVVLKAWRALTDCVAEDGLLGWVQPVGAAPGNSSADKTEVYGVGAFLAAGTEVYELLGGNTAPVQMAAAVPAAGCCEIFGKDTGWCWYEDPRAIIKNGQLILGGISGKSGDARVGVYDLKAERIKGVAVIHEKLERDDHDSPVFYARSDGRLLAMWARHSKDQEHFYSLSAPNDFLTWGARQEFHHDYEIPEGQTNRGITYMNLYTQQKEGLLYSFFRDGVNRDPTFITSSDQGSTWGGRTQFIHDEVDGKQRPYARYLQKDANTIAVSFTDAHPANFGNNLYYAEFSSGAFYRADGTKIKELADGALLTSEAERLYKGSGVRNYVRQESAANSAWSCAMAKDAAGNPHVGYTVFHTRDDLRYRVATWTGKQWVNREIASAGSCLYSNQSSYTGLMTFDPENPSRVYISTNADPSTGKLTGGTWEIYTAEIGLDDDVSTIEWTPVTKGSKYKNIRPIVVCGEGYKVLMWLGNGPWKGFCDYSSDALGMILERP